MGDQQKKHRCPVEGCNSAFSRPYRLTHHLLVHNNVKPFRCTEENCSKGYTNKTHLDRHINSVHKKVPADVVYICPRCMKKYANRQNLKRHIKIHHKFDYNAQFPFVCDTCEAKFKKKFQLAAHMHLHTGVKAFCCEECPKAFATLTEKKRHMRTHKQRTYKCLDCNLIFNKWSKYCKHSKTDHVVKEYICDVCERVFKKRHHIVRHVKIHDESKVFFCPYENCGRYYSRNANLRQHILIRHEKVTYDCTICKAQLSTKKSLQQHILKRHESEPKERIYKTKADGRKTRKDEGSLKTSTALMLAGLASVETETSKVQQQQAESQRES